MCDSGPIIFRKDLECSICGESPATDLEQGGVEDEDIYCRPCLVKTFGKKLVSEMENL